jgi:hypothetical protein
MVGHVGGAIRKGFHIAEDVGCVSCRQFRIGSEAMESSKSDPHSLGARSCGPGLLFRFEFPLDDLLGRPVFFAVGFGLFCFFSVGAAGSVAGSSAGALGLASIWVDFFCWRRGELFRPSGNFGEVVCDGLGRAPCEQTSEWQC